MAALRALPAGQREVLVLRHFAGLSEAQIASVTGISERAVANHATRAMSALQAKLPVEPSAEFQTAELPAVARTAAARPA
jgi:DNA-directed RNA polymerase specialized sigma24 family protein